MAWKYLVEVSTRKEAGGKISVETVTVRSTSKDAAERAATTLLRGEGKLIVKVLSLRRVK